MRVGFLPQAVRARLIVAAVSVVVATGWTAACASAGGSGRAGPGGLSPTSRAIHLLSRATYGVRQQDVDEVLRMGTKSWIDRQLDPARIADRALEERLQQLAQQQSQAAERLVVRTPPVQPQPVKPGQPQPTPPQQTAQMRAALVQVAQVAARLQVNALPDLVGAKLQRAVHSERQLEEVMTDFWFNHFNVFFNKGQVRLAVADYEQNAIRRHVFGRFEDMLVATAQHPAMLVYLDNFMSTAPVASQSGQAVRGAQRGGLNENYARELLELHTLGVDGGYTQQDVIAVARAFTGWGIATSTTRPTAAGGVVGGVARPATQSIDFRFQPERHDTGEKLVLGQTLAAGRGMEDGLDVLHMLAAHPSTARFIATKLVRHFVADDPPEKLVTELARVFTTTGGDLRAVTRALFTANEFYSAAHYRGKAKRPFEFVASALRVTGAEVKQSQALYAQLRTFAHLPYSEAAPTGYPTRAEEWFSAGSMLARINFAMELAAGRIAGVQFEQAVNAGAGSAAQPPLAESVRTALTADVLKRFLYGVQTDALSVAIAEDLAQQAADNPRTVTTRVIGLTLGSPDFQRY